MTKKHLWGGAAAFAMAAVAAAATVNSGLGVGDRVSPFDPTHVTGPDKGTNTCPVCKYGALPAAQVWVNGADVRSVAPIAKVLNDKAKASRFKGFVVFVIDRKDADKISKTLKDVASNQHLDSVALTWVDRGDESVSRYEVNTASDVKNTVFVYADRKVTAKFVNLKADKQDLGRLETAISAAVK